MWLALSSIPSRPKSLKYKLAIAGVAVFLVLSLTVIFLLLSSPKPASSTYYTPGPTETPKLADLKVWRIMIDPVQPQAGKNFNVMVEVANIGEYKSGPYDLAISIYDLTHDQWYTIGQFRLEPMDPTSLNQIPIVYNSNAPLVNYAGSHQIHVDLTPIGFDDKDESNNWLVSSFNVT